MPQRPTNHLTPHEQDVCDARERRITRKELAAELGVTPQAVKKTLARARAKLRRQACDRYADALSARRARIKIVPMSLSLCYGV